MAVQVARNRIALVTSYASGLRFSELVALRVEDINSARMLIHIREGKGQKARIAPLSEALFSGRANRS